MDKKERQNLLALLASTASECREAVESVRQSVLDRCTKLAGPELQEMLESPSKTRSYLSSTDPKLREAALYVFECHWGFDESWKPVLERMVVEDIDDDRIRGLALVNLGALYHGTNDARIGKMLAAFVHDESLSSEFRTSAYHALFDLRGLPTEYWPHTWSWAPSGWTFPRDVDWSFVKSFM